MYPIIERNVGQNNKHQQLATKDVWIRTKPNSIGNIDHAELYISTHQQRKPKYQRHAIDSVYFVVQTESVGFGGVLFETVEQRSPNRPIDCECIW